jgi:hypothetical protein
MSHPYSLFTEDLEQLKRLEANGWEIEITGRSHYYPGRTLCIRFSKRGSTES